MLEVELFLTSKLCIYVKAESFEIEEFICIKMNLALNNIQWFVCRKTKPKETKPNEETFLLPIKDCLETHRAVYCHLKRSWIVYLSNVPAMSKIWHNANSKRRKSGSRSDFPPLHHWLLYQPKQPCSGIWTRVPDSISLSNNLYAISASSVI